MTDLNNLPRPQSRQPIPETAKTVFTGHIFAVHQWPQRMYDGSIATFEKLSRADTVGVLAVTQDKKIVISQQEQPSMQPFISLLGGIVDSGEKPFTTAQRELLEEAGGETKDWKLWFSTQPISKIEWAMYMFIAKNCSFDQPQQLDVGEKISLKYVDFEEFIQIVFEPTFRDFEVTARIARMMALDQLNQFKQSLLGE